ncbi:hypothetical protein BY458DRAFT_521639 [Sporodiniella umbellata]|nr:hypothetical protein BY458DRAFT_521639 [Sporodiniella umbellata]
MFCLDNWTSKGAHKLVSLRCGHLFGESCILRWIENRNEKLGIKGVTCPICLKQIKTKDIRIVQPVRLVVKDTSEVEKILKELDTVKMEIKKQQNALQLSKLALSMCQRELSKIEKEGSEL